jgi:hypothetical protein
MLPRLLVGNLRLLRTTKAIHFNNTQHAKEYSGSRESSSSELTE